jgi:hypothetical protein
MPNFGIPRRASQAQREEVAPLNWRRGLFRIWLLVSAGWIMGWTIYLILEGVQGGFSTRADLIVVPILLFAPPIALLLFGLAGGWALRGFEPDP